MVGFFCAFNRLSHHVLVLNVLAGEQADQVLDETDGHEQSAHGHKGAEYPLRQLGTGSELALIELVEGHEKAKIADNGGKSCSEGHGDNAQNPAHFGSDPVSYDGQSQVCAPLCGDGRAQKTQQDEKIGGDLLGEREGRAEYITGDDIDKSKSGHHHKTYTDKYLFNIVKYFIHSNSPVV